ncbi:MAG: putative Ig domain-containing protein, partial [Dehalococcoidia bacterium]
HGLGLGHSNVDGAVMEPYYEGERRALHQDDIDGISFLYPSGAITPATLEVTTTSVPNGTDDVGYDVTLEATGGTLSYTWAITSGLLPTGLILNTSTGEISGTPNTMGTSNFTVKVTDSSDPAQSDSQALSIIIDEAPQAGSSVIVDLVTYDTEGGKDGKKHLSIIIALVDDLGGGVSGASVSITLTNDTSGGPWVGTGTTGASGTVTFQLKNSPSGCYVTTVTDITADGWEPNDPANTSAEFCK